MSEDLSTDEQYLKMYEAMCLYCEKKNYGDPFSYGRGKEIYMAIRLNHTISSTLAGADGYEDKELTIPAEYKATTCKSIKATYNGISVQSTWEEQVKYLKEKKICKYKNHYIARFKNGKIQGVLKDFNKSGRLNFAQKYVNGIKVLDESFYDSGKTENIWAYKDGKLNGTSKMFYETGEVKKVWNYLNIELGIYGNIKDG